MKTRIWIAGLFLITGCYSSGPAQYDNNGRDDYTAATVEDLMEYLIRKYNPGVRVYRTNGRLQLRIRGSLQEPLYILDGVPLGGGPGRALVGLNPNDIEDVEVVTDLARLSLYGLRGGSGAVLITTKR